MPLRYYLNSVKEILKLPEAKQFLGFAILSIMILGSVIVKLAYAYDSKSRELGKCQDRQLEIRQELVTVLLKINQDKEDERKREIDRKFSLDSITYLLNIKQ